MKRRHRFYKLDFSKLKAILAVFFIIIVISVLFNKIITRNRINIKIDDLAAFRVSAQSISDVHSLAQTSEINFYEALAFLFIEEDFFPEKTVALTKEQLNKNLFDNYAKLKKKYNSQSVNQIATLFENIFSELVYFPIPNVAEIEPQNLYMYGDSWGALRSYGGKRGHEGVDILDRENIPGRIPIVSMTDGVIENLGWNEKGGWRIGIRTIRDTYYYYAHLDTYADSLHEGMKISAGSLLGYMGNSGYSKKEGTVGNFVVHLHLGIMPNTALSGNKEFWVNPYPILRFIEGNKAALQ